MSADERIFAYKGYYIAVYAQDVGGGAFVGVAAICVDRPADVKRAKPVEGVVSAATYPDPKRAAKAAEHQAKQIVDGLAPNWDPFTRPGSIR